MATIKINGMHCNNCKNAVEKAVSAIPGIKKASVNLEKKELEYQEENPVSVDIILETIQDLGFEPVNPGK